MASHLDSSVTNDYRKESDSVLFNKGKTFYWAKFFLDKHAALQATRLYRFCRYIDDIADEAPDKALAEKTLKQTIADLQHGISKDVIINDAIALFKECSIPVQIPIELIQGVLADLSLVRINTEAQLIEYSYQVAGTVGLMMSKVLNVQNSKAFFHAVDLGIAMQLTNISRDIREDAQLNRMYLPQSMIGQIKPENVLALEDSHRTVLMQAVKILLNKADQYYSSGYAGLCYLPFRSRVSILIAAKLYQQIGIEIQREQFKGLHTKAYVPVGLKLRISVQVFIKALFDLKFWFYRSQHDAQLHQLIAKFPFCNG